MGLTGLPCAKCRAPSRGEVTPNIDSVYTLEQTIDVHRRMAAGAATGKLVVLPHPETTRATAARARAG